MYKTVNETVDILLYKAFEICHVLHIHTYPFGRATFKVLSSRMWPVVTILGSVALEPVLRGHVEGPVCGEVG